MEGYVSCSSIPNQTAEHRHDAHAKNEAVFQEKGCSISRVEVFEPNVNAHGLYHKLEYRDRIIDMIKELGQT